MNFLEALKVSQKAFMDHSHWDKLDGTPWANDAPVIAAQLMCQAAAELERRAAEARDTVLAQSRREAERAINRLGARVALQPDIVAKANIALDDYRLLESRLARLEDRARLTQAEAREAALLVLLTRAAMFVRTIAVEGGRTGMENSADLIDEIDAALSPDAVRKDT